MPIQPLLEAMLNTTAIARMFGINRSKIGREISQHVAELLKPGVSLSLTQIVQR